MCSNSVNGFIREVEALAEKKTLCGKSGNVGNMSIFCLRLFFVAYFVFFAVEPIKVGYSEVKSVGRRSGWLVA